MALFDINIETQHRKVRAAVERCRMLRNQKAQRRIAKQQQRILAFLPSVLQSARKRAKKNYRRGGAAGGEVNLPLFRSVPFSIREDPSSPLVRHVKIGQFFEEELDRLSVDGWSYRVVLGHEMFRHRRIIGVRAQHL